jgi:8-oxo-dGTP diphosphatase
MAAAPSRAAGGVVWRRRGDAVEIAVVHRPRYDDWSLPKGKQARDETALETAVREVGEELGASVAVQQRIGTYAYDAAGQPKQVTYWAMSYCGGEFVPNDEADGVRWVPVGDAGAVLSYDTDKDAVTAFAAQPRPEAVLVLVRHAKAGKRAEWNGDDALRPLDTNGATQAERLASLLSYFAPQRVFSADRVRCVATVEPLAKAIDVEVRVDPVFNDEAYLDAPPTTEAAFLALAEPGTVSVVCSQGDAIPSMIERLARAVGSAETRKGAWWVLPVVGGAVVGADHYDAP